MANVNPQDAAAAWAQRLSASTDKIAKGIDAVTVAPGQAAARQADVWANNTIASKPKWQANVAAVSLQDWQKAAKEKGVQRIPGGAQAAQAKFADFMTQLLPHIDRVKGTLQPRGNLDQNINRMVAFSRGMSQFKKS
jgi:hypothetical protein